MPKEYSRTQRLGEQIRRELSVLVRDEINDPRMGMVSFTAVKLSRDLGHATIYCSFMQPEDKDETLTVLNHAAGFLRHQLADRVHARKLPALKFINDESLERGAYLSDLIDRVRSEDAAKGLIEDDESDQL